MAVQLSASEITLDEFEAHYAGKRYEYVDGFAVPVGPEIIGENGEVMVAATKSIHGRVVGRLTIILGRFVLDNALGEIFGAETGFLVKGDVRAADIAFYPTEQVRAFQDKEWLPFPPTLAIEVISEYDKTSDTRRKAQMYMGNGTRLLWVVYPDSQMIDVFRPGQPIVTLGIDDTLDGGDVLPGFAVAVKEIFAPLDTP